MTHFRPRFALRTLSIIMLLVWSATAWAGQKPTYRFTVQIDGMSDTTLYLGYYYADRYAVIDSARNNGRGKFSFEGNKEIHPGLYFFTDNKGHFLDFVYYHEKPHFQFHTDTQGWGRSMTVKGSKQNELFMQFNHQNAMLYDLGREGERGLDSAALRTYRQQQAQKADSLKADFVEKHPEAMISKMMLATRLDEPPTIDDEGNPLSQNQRWEWLMDHYFDYMPLDDDFIIRTPKAVFYQSVVDYVDKYMKGLPPSMICPRLDTLIDRAEPAPEVFRWLVITLTEKFLQSNIMVYDEVYVHLAQRYYGSGKAIWSAPSTIDEVVERANKWERLLVGREAPELILFDTLHRPFSLHHMPGRYTLLLFWSPTCGHCRDIVPAVYNEFEAYAERLDLTAFAILTEPTEETIERWKEFLVSRGMTSQRWVHLPGGEANVDWREVYDVSSTPQIYLIRNSDHTIVAKKLNAEVLHMVLESLTNNAVKE